MTLQDRVDFFQLEKKNLNSVLDTAFKQRNHSVNWQCDLRKYNEHDHEWDGIKDLKLTKAEDIKLGTIVANQLIENTSDHTMSLSSLLRHDSRNILGY